MVGSTQAASGLSQQEGHSSSQLFTVQTGFLGVARRLLTLTQQNLKREWPAAQACGVQARHVSGCRELLLSALTCCSQWNSPAVLGTSCWPEGWTCVARLPQPESVPSHSAWGLRGSPGPARQWERFPAKTAAGSRVWSAQRDCSIFWLHSTGVMTTSLEQGVTAWNRV